VSLKTKIISGQGRPWAAGVTRDQALKVEVMPTRRTGIDSSLASAEKLYRDYFRNGASSAMNVLGSLATPVRFTIASKTDRLLAIRGLRIFFDSTFMDCAGAELRRFGAVATGTALVNGLTLVAIQGNDNTSIFADPVVVIGDFFQYTETFINRVDGVAAGTDILNFRIDFEIPVILPAGSSDRIEFSVRDDLRAIASFKALAFGTQELVVDMKSV
jgi:hypothetical protein